MYEKYWRGHKFRVCMVSQIYVKIKSSRIKGVLQYHWFTYLAQTLLRKDCFSRAAQTPLWRSCKFPTYVQWMTLWFYYSPDGLCLVVWYMPLWSHSVEFLRKLHLCFLPHKVSHFFWKAGKKQFTYINQNETIKFNFICR